MATNTTPTQTEAAMDRTAHITIVPPRPQGRPGYSADHFLRVGGGTRPVRTNLCGAAPTDRDFSPRDVRRTLKLGPQAVAEWHLCAQCLAKFTTQKGA